MQWRFIAEGGKNSINFASLELLPSQRFLWKLPLGRPKSCCTLQVEMLMGKFLLEIHRFENEKFILHDLSLSLWEKKIVHLFAIEKKICWTLWNLWLFADDCRMGNGRYYLGTVNVTQAGIPCQHWDSQSPHTHIQPPNVFPEVRNAENFCRNAGGSEPYPWCYTSDPSTRWSYCDVPLCREYPIF